MITNSCPHCGAPIQGDKCEYCGAVFYDWTALDVDGGSPTYLKIKVGGKIHLLKAVTKSIDLRVESNYSNVFYLDDKPCYVGSPYDYHLSIDMDVVPEDNIIHTIIDPKEAEASRKGSDGST